MHSLAQEIKVSASLLAAVYTASANGSVVDTLGFDTASVVISTGAIDLVGGDETYSFKVQEGALADGSDMADVSGATATVTAANQQKKIALNGLTTARKRYLRVVMTQAGATSSLAVAAPIVLARGYNSPQA